MDKKRNFISYIFLVGVVILIVSFVKVINHKKEINNLLEAEDISKSYVATENKYNGSEDDGNNLDSNTNTTSSTSNGVAKKSKNGKDFLEISKDENIENINSKVEDGIKYQDNINNEIELLARLIYSEAGNQPYMGKVAVGNVVLYRSLENGQSIESIIYSKNQFDGINTDNFNKEPNEESKKAALEVLNGELAIKEGYYYANLNLCSPDWAKNKTFICRIGDHWFFRKG